MIMKSNKFFFLMFAGMVGPTSSFLLSGNPQSAPIYSRLSMTTISDSTVDGVGEFVDVDSEGLEVENMPLPQIKKQFCITGVSPSKETPLNQAVEYVEERSCDIFESVESNCSKKNLRTFQRPIEDSQRGFSLQAVLDVF
jgi:hypothetical protein